MSKAASSTWEKISNRVKNSAEKKEAPSNPLEATVEELKQENARLKELVGGGGEGRGRLCLRTGGGMQSAID